LILGLYT
jgi:formylglycine-generating enzyme required for sulfatase activity